MLLLALSIVPVTTWIMLLILVWGPLIVLVVWVLRSGEGVTKRTEEMLERHQQELMASVEAERQEVESRMERAYAVEEQYHQEQLAELKRIEQHLAQLVEMRPRGDADRG